MYRYGCPAEADLDAAAMAQLRLAHDLRNDLVGILRRHEAEIAAAWATRPELAELATAAADREAAVRSVLEQVRRWKVDGHSQSVPSGLRDEAAQARVALRAARAALRGAKQAAFDALRPLFAASAESMRAERKATYARWV